MPRKTAAGGKDVRNVEVSRLTESKIMQVLKERDGEVKAMEHAGIKKVGKVLDELIELGFAQELAAKAIQCTPTVTVPDCLDWLCLNIEEDQLPRKFRSSYSPAEMPRRRKLTRRRQRRRRQQRRRRSDRWKQSARRRRGKRQRVRLPNAKPGSSR